MSSTPVGPNSTPRNFSQKYPYSRPKAEARVSSSGTSDAEAAATERDAQQRISNATQSVEDAQIAANHQLDQIKDQYDNQLENEIAREDDAIEKQRLKGYEALRNLKRQQEAEMHRTKQEGERDITKLQDYYRDTTYADRRQGETALNELKAAQGREMEHATKSGELDYTMAKADHERKLVDLREDQEQQYNKLHKDAVDKYESMKEQTNLANERENEHFQGTYKANLAQDQKALDLVAGKATTQLNQIRADTSQKLAAYQERQSDPFYKLKDIDADLREEGDRFVLTATIPIHEQDHVSVSVSGNNLIISGTRRNEEKLDLGPGRSKSSASYQTYQETFPLSWPVQRNLLTREFHGDRLIVTVPKASEYFKKDPFKSAYAPERLRAERPHFPGNLPTSESIQPKNAQNDESGSETNSESRPLT